ncbi:hypothetical protein Fmac_031929 [Flemingia macrophylla]|uniref:Uncharacterized protein n=1 Tax=Flemingia macrophylla TaxID=520843 RepID=A0ABD1L3W6_9FABA
MRRIAATRSSHNAPASWGQRSVEHNYHQEPSLEGYKRSLRDSLAFHSPSGNFFNKPRSQVPHRSTSPTRVNIYSASPSPSSSVRFALDRSISPNRTVSSHVIAKKCHVTAQKRTCMCSPTTHPGSFRCSLHKNNQAPSGSFPSNRLNMRRSAMKNSLVRIGGVEGEWVKRALTALIRPSSHQQRRRAAFESRPSRSFFEKPEYSLLRRPRLKPTNSCIGSEVSPAENLEDYSVDLRVGMILDEFVMVAVNVPSFVRDDVVRLRGGFDAAVDSPLSLVQVALCSELWNMEELAY